MPGLQSKSPFMALSTYYALVFMSGGVFGSYIGLYYASIHLSNFTVGLLTTISAVVALIAQPIWGVVSDRSPTKNRILLLCLAASAGTIWIVPLSGTVLWMLTLGTAIFTIFQCAINPLSDAMTLELADQGLFRFSTVRTIGSLGYAIMSAIAGWVFAVTIRPIFSFYFLLMLLSISTALLIPRVRGHQRPEQRVKLIEIFRNRKLLMIYVYAFVIESTLGFFFAFHAIYSQQVGISTGLIGVGIMIGSFSQFPFMIFFDRLYRRYGVTRILLVSGIVHAVRWLLYAVWLTPASIIVLWVLHGGTYILFYLCLAQYVNENVQIELKASGQMMNAVIMSGVSKIAGGLVGGAVASKIGIGRTFGFSAAVCAVAVALYAAVSLSQMRRRMVPLANKDSSVDLQA